MPNTISVTIDLDTLSREDAARLRAWLREAAARELRQGHRSGALPPELEQLGAWLELHGVQACTVGEALLGAGLACGVDVESQMGLNRGAALLSGLGWVHRRATIGGVRAWRYHRPEADGLTQGARAARARHARRSPAG